MTPRLRYALAALALLPLVMSGLTLWGATVYYHREQAAQQHQAAVQAASQQRQAAQQAASQRAQGAAFEHKLCTTLDRLAALQPPGGSPADNPSRAYLQGQHDVLAELGPDVGCRR